MSQQNRSRVYIVHMRILRFTITHGHGRLLSKHVYSVHLDERGYDGKLLYSYIDGEVVFGFVHESPFSCVCLKFENVIINKTWLNIAEWRHCNISPLKLFAVTYVRRNYL